MITIVIGGETAGGEEGGEGDSRDDGDWVPHLIIVIKKRYSMIE